MTYTRIPLDKLDEVRTALKLRLKDLPEKHTIRTFYLGPRRKTWAGSDLGTTAKADAYAAKIAIYKTVPNKWGQSQTLAYYL